MEKCLIHFINFSLSIYTVSFSFFKDIQNKILILTTTLIKIIIKFIFLECSLSNWQFQKFNEIF